MILGSAGTPHDYHYRLTAACLSFVWNKWQTWLQLGCRGGFLGAEERQEVGIRCSSSLLWLYRDTHTATWRWCATRQRCSWRIPAATEHTHLLITTQNTLGLRHNSVCPQRASFYQPARPAPTPHNHPTLCQPWIVFLSLMEWKHFIHCQSRHAQMKQCGSVIKARRAGEKIVKRLRLELRKKKKKKSPSLRHTEQRDLLLQRKEGGGKGCARDCSAGVSEEWSRVIPEWWQSSAAAAAAAASLRWWWWGDSTPCVWWFEEEGELHTCSWTAMTTLCDMLPSLPPPVPEGQVCKDYLEKNRRW